MAAALLAGCERKEATNVHTIDRSVPSEITARISALETNLAAQSNLTTLSIQWLASQDSQHFDYLSNWCNNLGQLVATKKESKSISYVTINPEQKDYALLQTGHGVLFVKTESAESYLDGYKIHLQIGNPSAATYLGFKLEIAWGEMKTPADYQDRTNNFTDTLKAGFWTPIEVVITPATPASLRKAIVNIELNEVQLRQSPLPQ